MGAHGQFGGHAMPPLAEGMPAMPPMPLHLAVSQANVAPCAVPAAGAAEAKALTAPLAAPVPGTPKATPPAGPVPTAPAANPGAS
jgi:hypothetical protein